MSNAILIKDGLAKVVEFKDDIDNIDKLVECSCFDIIDRYAGIEKCVFIVDDEGLLKNKRLSLVEKHGKEKLFGNILIVKRDNNDPSLFRGLNNGEISNIMQHFQKCGAVYSL